MSARGYRGAIAVALLIALVPAPPAQARLVARGVALDVVFGEPASRAADDVDAAAGLGATAIRVSVNWSGMEPLARGRYAEWYLQALDAVVARARRRHISVLLTPVSSPCWASSGSAGLPALLCSAGRALPGAAIRPPADVGDYARFTAFLAQRYRGALAGIEIWNEPNTLSFWDTQAPAAVAYVALLRASYRAVKRAAPGVPVVAGALAGSDVAFLDKLYAGGMAGSYDVLSVHAYNDGRAPDTMVDRRYAGASWLQGLRELRRTLRAHGDGHPVWITEMGWNTSIRRGAIWLDGVTPGQQAAYLTRAIQTLDDPAGGVDYPSAAFVFRLRDLGTDVADPEQNYGLEAADGTPKPALAAVRRAFTASASRRRSSGRPTGEPVIDSGSAAASIGWTSPLLRPTHHRG